MLNFLLFPFRLFAHLLSLALLIVSIAVVAVVAYGAYNYFKPAPRVSIDNLAAGTVEVRAADRVGTGAIVQSGNDWLVVTAAHVVTDAKTVDVIDRQGVEQQGDVVSANADLDVAIVSVKERKGWLALPVTATEPAIGAKVTTRCFFDTEPREGLFGGPVNDVRDGDEHVAQFDLNDILAQVKGDASLESSSVLALMPVEPGCSGSPLLNDHGQMIAIIVAGNEHSTIAIAAGSALPLGN